uniref:SWIM-type domain-containing protein n=1 Tax=Plectus sambesii TaxID=2011161 RepID=A0A914WYR7_9BILA
MYKLKWNGYPVNVIGCTDKSGRFHSFCLAIMKVEMETDFTLIFWMIRSLATQLLNLQFSPSVLVAKCANVIANGFSSAFSNDFVRVNCWAHVHRNMQKQLLTIKSEKLRLQFTSDINALQLAHSVDSFNKAVALLAEKWDAIGEDSSETVKRQTEQSLQHFVEEYCDRYPGWFEGHAPGHPSHNNALESTNNVIKTEYTMRSRLPVTQFAKAVNYVPFDSKVPKKEKNYEEVYSLICEKQKMLTQRSDGVITTFISKKDLTNITSEQVCEYKRHFHENHWPPFDTYVEMRMSLWAVSIPTENWKSSTCSCPPFLKKHKCKHLIAVAATFNPTSIPISAKAIVLGQKKKRGHPAKATKALVRD